MYKCAYKYEWGKFILIPTLRPIPGCTSSIHIRPQTWPVDIDVAQCSTNTRGWRATKEHTIDQPQIYQPQQLILWEVGSNSV